MIDPSMPPTQRQDRSRGEVGFAQGIAIGHFDEDCRKVSLEEVREQYRRKGLCSFCGKVVTHTKRMGISGFYMEPMTKENEVYEGYCLKCHTLEEVMEKPDIKAKLEAKRKKKAKPAPLFAVRESTGGSAGSRHRTSRSLESDPEKLSSMHNSSLNNLSLAEGHICAGLEVQAASRCVEEIVNYMSAEPKSASLQASGCANLGRLADAPPESIATAVNSIVEAMNAHVCDNEVQKEGCRALRRLSSSADPNASSNTEDVQVNVHNCSRIALQGGLVAVLRAMKAKSINRPVHREGIRVLRNVLCAHPESNQIIIEHDGTEIIIRIMRSNIDSSHIQEDACIILWSLSYNDAATQNRILESKGIESIIKAMSSYVALEKVQYHGCGALHTLSNNKTLKPVILENGGFDATVTSLREHGYSLLVTEKSLAALVNLAVTSADDSKGRTKLCVMDKEEIGTVVNAMQLHGDSDRVQKIGCYFLELASRSPSNLKILRAHRELRSLLRDARKNFPKSCMNSASAVLSMMDDRSPQEI